MAAKKEDYSSWSLAHRFWVYQWERIPVLMITVVTAANLGVVYSFSEQPMVRYLAAISVIVLYMIQIRASDEKKDFEHDNKFHTDRPVQRGLVTLDELAVVNYLAIGAQLAIYAAFRDPQILFLGVVSQGYAFLTRKEFFVRDWIRQHFHIYNFSHYAQLVILQYAMLVILRPLGISYVLLILYAVAHASLMELGRKMYSAKEDTTDDSYSAQLGNRGASLALGIAGTIAVGFSTLLITEYDRDVRALAISLPALLLLYVGLSQYAKKASKKNSQMVQGSAILVFLASTLSVIVGDWL